MQVAKVELIPVSKLVPNPWNPNAMSQEAFNRLLKEVQEVGFIDSVQVVPLTDGTYRIIGGEHRWRAATELGIEEIPAAILSEAQWQDEDLQKLVTVRLNALRGRIDPTRMAKLYDEMARKYGAEALKEVFAYADTKEWDRLLTAIDKSLSKAKLDKETTRKFKDKAREARTVDDLTRILQQIFANYGDTLSYSFMVFTYGDQEHVYVNLSQDTHKAVKEIMEYCKNTATDINTELSIALRALAETLKARDVPADHDF